MQSEPFPIATQNKWIPGAKHTMTLSFFWQVIFSLVNISEAFSNHLPVTATKWFHSWQQGASPAVVLACCSVSLSPTLLKAWWDSLLSSDYVICPPSPVVTIRHVIYYSVFPATWRGPFSEAFHMKLGDNILSQEFPTERLTELPTLLRVASHLDSQIKIQMWTPWMQRRHSLHCTENQHHR